MFGVSVYGPATSFARSAVEAKVRAALQATLEVRAAAPNGRPIASRIAMVCVWRVVRLLGAAGQGGSW
jgi:hypothetical protein